MTGKIPKIKNLKFKYQMISIIAIVGKNRAIGRNNQLLWDIPEDLRYFKEKTRGKTVVMGRQTFISIGKPLPGRSNIVATLDSAFQAEGVKISHSLEELLRKAQKYPEEIFVIGGSQIYTQSLPYAEKLYLTLVEDSPTDADAFFPDYSEFSKEISREEHDDGKYKFTFLELTK